VRQAAVHALGLERDADVLAVLPPLVIKDEPAIRLKAAEAVGRIGKQEGIPMILESVRQGNLDRFLEHALIYALIQINDPKATLAALEDPNPRVRQAGLIALDQMKDGKLTREQVVPLLDTDDPDLQQAVLGVISKHPDWSKETTGLLREWLASTKRTPAQEKSLVGALLAFCSDEYIQKLVADTLTETKPSLPTRLLMLQVVARCRLDSLPRHWLGALGEALQDRELAVRREVIATIKARNLTQFDKLLLDLSKDAKLPGELRIAALDCLAPRQSQVAPDLFTLLTQHLSEKVEPLLRVAAARTLGASPLTKDQLLQLAEKVTEAGPMIVPVLMPAYARSRDGDVGLILVRALQKSPGTDSMAVEDLDRLLRNYPEDVQKFAQSLHDKLAAKQKEQAAYLAKLTLELLNAQGNVERGKEVFFSKKVACYGCHKAMSKGGSVGPDLSLVGRFRTTRDLLESVVFPSSSIIPDFRSYVVVTKDGRTVTGMIVRESAEEVFLRTTQLAEIRIARKDIEEMTPSPVSIMPQGLEKTLSRQELSDLLEFLYSQR
jgi:putative heme-binding domain-containing protein